MEIHFVAMNLNELNMKSWVIDPKKAGCAIGIRYRVRQQISSILIVYKKESCPVPCPEQIIYQYTDNGQY